MMFSKFCLYGSKYGVSFKASLIINMLIDNFYYYFICQSEDAYKKAS